MLIPLTLSFRQRIFGSMARHRGCILWYDPEDWYKLQMKLPDDIAAKNYTIHQVMFSMRTGTNPRGVRFHSCRRHSHCVNFQPGHVTCRRNGEFVVPPHEETFPIEARDEKDILRLKEAKVSISLLKKLYWQLNSDIIREVIAKDKIPTQFAETAYNSVEIPHNIPGLK